MTTKHIVVCHGYSLAENPELEGVVNKRGDPVPKKFGDWREVCIGVIEESRFVCGRIHTAIDLADNLDAEAIIWSTGATWLPDGTSEARYMFNQAVKMYDFELLPRAEDWLRRISMFEEDGLNTAETMCATRKILSAQYPHEPIMLHHVSSANHMPRVMRDAAIVFGDMSRVILSGVPAQTSYGRKTPANVVIHELGEPRN